MIAIVDYGMGNLKSLQNALKSIDIPSTITSGGDEILKCEGIIVPGVGAFPDAISNIRKMGLDSKIKTAAKYGKPVLGICLGMQLLFDEGQEIIKCEGLGLLKGTIKKIEGSVKIPQIGWNGLNFKKECPLLKGIDEGSYVYFVHSYYAELGEDGILNAYTIYGNEIPAVVSRGNVYGVQFHPEKSGDVGIKMLKNFGELTV